VEKDQKTKPDPEVEEKPVEETAQVSASPDSPAAAEDRAEVNLEEVSTSEAANAEDGSPSKKRRSKDIIAAYLNSAGVERNLMEADENTKVLAILNEKIKEAELELKSVLKTLQQSKNKRKRAASGENKFHGWGSSEAKKVKKAAYNSKGSNKLHLDAAGARFGLTEFDFVTLDTDQTLEEPLLQVIFSPPMLRDLKKLESSQVSGITQIQPSDKPDTAEKLPDSEDDRGSHSPDSYGSSKENDPEIVNTVTTTIYKQSRVSSTKKKSNLKNPVLKSQLEVS